MVSFTGLHCRCPSLKRLCVLLACGLGWAAGGASEAHEEIVAAHAARLCIAALDDVDRFEAKLLELEKSANKGGSALEAGTVLHRDVSFLLDSALAAVRFAAASVTGEGQRELDAANASFVEQQLLALMVANPGHAPLYFWHGPRRMVLPRLRGLLRSGDMRSTLSQLAQKATPASAALISSSAAGGDCGSPTALTMKDSYQGQVPRLGVALSGSTCSTEASCNFWPVLAAAGSGADGAAHLLAMPSAETAQEMLLTMRSVLSQRPASMTGPMPYLSIALAPEWVQPRVNLTTVVGQLLNALGQERADMLWLPYAAFMKKQWSRAKQDLDILISSNIIGGYGLNAEVSSKSLLTSLLGRKPAPKAWLTGHDVLRPVTSAAREAAEAAGVEIVTMPRRPLLKAASEHLSVVAGTSQDAQEGVQLLSALQSGLKVVLDISGATDVIKHALDSKLDLCSLTYVQSLAAFTQPFPIAGAAAASEASRRQHALEARLAASALQGGQAASNTLLAGVGLASALPQKEDWFQPGVHESWLQNMEKQKKEFAKNNFILYRENFFDDATFKAIKAEAKRLWKSEDIEANCNLDGRNRAGGYVLDASNVDTSLYHLVYGNEPFRRWLSTVNDQGEMWPSDFPIELREYGEKSKGMMCHSDLQMYAVVKKDMEFVVTIDNDSACNVSFTNLEGVETWVHTKANSIMIVRPNSAVHCVSDTLGGSRTILKGIYVGDYRKSRDFSMYTENSCDDRNPNRQIVKRRREKPAAAHGESSGETSPLEL